MLQNLWSSSERYLSNASSAYVYREDETIAENSFSLRIQAHLRLIRCRVTTNGIRDDDESPIERVSCDRG